MHFIRDCGVTVFCSCKNGIQYILYITSVLESSCTNVNAGSRHNCSLHCSTYVHAAVRTVVTRTVSLPYGPAPSAVVSAALRLLALIAWTAWMLCLQEQKTVTKKSLFSEISIRTFSNQGLIRFS
jgi:hypothetical protein